MGTPLNFQLSNEQQLFIEKALQGENILVDHVLAAVRPQLFKIYVMNCQVRKKYCI